MENLLKSELKAFGLPSLPVEAILREALSRGGDLGEIFFKLISVNLAKRTQHLTERFGLELPFV